MEPFIVNTDITDLENLYGRSRQIKILKSCAKRKGNVGIIGARRFGKTCILKSMENYLNGHREEYAAYPIYFDVKSQCSVHKDTTAVYRHIATLLASKMCQDGIIDEGTFKISRKCSLGVSPCEVDMQVEMEQWPSVYQKEVVFSLAKKLSERGLYLLLFLDEVDYLLLEAFESPSDFSRIRTAATDSSCNLKFWVAGTSGWSAICTNVGSPELNCGLENVTMEPLSKDEFSEMWNKECILVKNDITRKKLFSLEEDVFNKTGGVPFYAKYVGSCVINKNLEQIPDYSIIRDYLGEIFNSRFLTDAEKSALIILSNNQKNYAQNLPDGISALKTKGLVINEKDEYFIPIGYLADYICAVESNSALDIDIEKKEIEITVDEIMRLRNVVNRLYRPNDPFTTSTEDPMNYKALKNICVDEGVLTTFATSLYLLYYEGSDKGRRLPSDFYKHDFCNAVRALRHKYEHRDCEPTIITDQELFVLVNNGKAPFKREHYMMIQKNILDMFKNELINMQESFNGLIQKNSVSQQGTVISHYHYNQPNNLQDGEEYEGIIVKTTNVNGTFLNVKCIFHSHPLQIINRNSRLFEGAEVIFTARAEPNKNDPLKIFWKADDVHLKEI